jgi:hypothetical protein
MERPENAPQSIAPQSVAISSVGISNLAAALALAQGQIKSASKDATNPHFKNRYASLASVWDACRSALAANKLSLSQHPSADVQRKEVSVTTILLHASGEYLQSTLAAPLTQMTPQAIGSAITYARRYALSGIVGIAPDDDDDGNATQPQVKGKRDDDGFNPRATDHVSWLTKEFEKRKLDKLTSDEKNSVAKALTGRPLSDLEAVLAEIAFG